MSRHSLMPKDPSHSVWVGWDNPIQTFFAQVSREDEDEDAELMLLWLGGIPHECPTAESLVEPLRPYADLDDAMLAQLRGDMAESNRPTDLQLMMRQLTRDE